MSQSYSYPSSSNVTLTGSTNGLPIPNDSIVVGGENASGNTEPLQLDASNRLIVTLGAAPATISENLVQVGGAAIALGQTTMAASLPVAIASDQSAVPISAAALPLPAGASTSALQTQISGQLPATLGAQLIAASLAVNVASDQVVPVSATALPLPAGAATSANQTNASQKTQLVDGSGNVIASTTNALNVDVINFPATQPVSGTVTANQGSANATPWNENIAQIAGAAVQVGHGTAAATLRVELPTDGTGVVGLNAGANTIGSISNISGTISLPTGASTSAIQTNGTQKTQIFTPTALTVTQAAIAVGTAAVRLTVSGSAPAATRVVLMANVDSAVTAKFYIGSSSVANSGANRGIEMVAGQTFIANNDAGDYYIISDTTAQTVLVMEQA